MKLAFKTLSPILTALTLLTGCVTQKPSQDKMRVQQLGTGGDTQTSRDPDPVNLDKISPSPSSRVSSSPRQTPRPSITLNVPKTIYPPVPSLPPSFPKPRYHGFGAGEFNWHAQSITKLLEYETKLSLGVGHLRPKDLSPFNLENAVGAGWIPQVILPLYKQPGGQHWGWLAGGWLLRPSGKATDTFVPDSRPFTTANISYKCTVCSLVVLEIRQDGWFKFRYAEPTPDDEGTAWAHQAHLELGKIPLIVESWEQWLPENFRDAFFFVNEGRHAVRHQPTSESQPVAWLQGRKRPPDKDKRPVFDVFVPRVVQGDWMRVEVRQDGCISNLTTETTNNPKCQEGWIRWRNSEQGSLVWYTDW